MNRINAYLLFILWIFGSQVGYAELKLDTTKHPDHVKKILTPLFESVVRPYNLQHAAEFSSAFPKSRKFTSYPNYPGSNFAWLFNGATFYSSISAFVPEIAQLENCKPSPDELNPGDRCDWRVTRFNVCHLFMFNGKDNKLESVTRLNIERDKKNILGLPRCDSVEAMAIAKTTPDAMLITIRYMDSAEPADPRNEPPWFYSTLLLRFGDEHGKLNIEQDDSCLGNPNKIRTIAAARKTLEKCASPIK